ncbi:MAG: hypothetical protein U0939_21825 [Pirellulales bacterium]
MFDILRVLIQFVFRVTFGLALAMGCTPPRQVTSGYYQKHLWVLMGLNTLASLAVFSSRQVLDKQQVSSTTVLALAISLAVACYLASVTWLYEAKTVGRAALFVIALAGGAAAVLATPPVASRGASSAAPVLWTTLDVATGGLVLGVVLAAMFLGHWYLNTPTMQLAPLKRLILILLAVLVVRLAVSGGGVALRVATADAALPTEFWLFLALRMLAGVAGTFSMGWMAWETLKIPNTQSATGVLYAGVILAFIGELTSQLMSVGQIYPV